jgi:hypothetical protein
MVVNAVSVGAGCSAEYSAVQAVLRSAHGYALLLT